MRMPKTPPHNMHFWSKIAQDESIFKAIMEVSEGPLVGGKYLHWDQLIRREAPPSVDHKDWWQILKLARRQQYRTVPLLDKQGEHFQYGEVHSISETLHKIDMGAGGLIQMPRELSNPETRDRYYVSSLIQEAISSSQLEGAGTTRQVGQAMIRSGRRPTNRSERMIFNNYLAMRKISSLKNEPLSKETILELHRIVTDKTLDDSGAAGRLRRKNEVVRIISDRDDVLHSPPSADQLDERMEAMCNFANGTRSKEFIHPVIRSIILHFWLAYDHPFVDGNGRTARALFYWSMLHNNYWLFEFVSISSILVNAPTKYYKAFLYTETDENDLTYFIMYNLDVIERALDELHDYIARKTKQVEALDLLLHTAVKLNNRQRALLSHALRHPRFIYTVESHGFSHHVVHQTSRKDLHNLVSKGVLDRRKIGKTWQFIVPTDLEERLRNLA